MKNDPFVLKHKSILIVDDELEITKALARQFKRKYTVLTATTAQEALQILETEDVQVIISDQRMPEMTGVEFFTSIKKTYPDIIKLILTGYSDIEATIAAINHGQVFRYITKPWNPDEINSIIVEAFDKYELIASNKDLIANLEEKVKIRTNELEEQKQNLELSQKELLEAEWKFKALFELGPIGVAYHKMIYDADGKASDYYFIDANESYKELTGVSPKGRTAREVFPGIENDPANWISVFGEVAKSGKTIRFEQFLEFNKRWYDCVAYQYKPNHFVAAFNETTKKKEIEIALIENEAKFRNIFEHSLVGKSITSLDGRLKVNVAFSNIVGYTEAELNSLNWKKITHPDDIAKNAEIVQSLLNGEKQSEYWQKRYIHKNGQIVWVDITTTLQRDFLGNAQFFITEITDITEQKFAQSVLLKNERRYRALVENVEDLVLIVDVNGQINYTSPVFERITGFTLDEYLQLPAKDFVHPDDFSQISNLWMESQMKPSVPIHVKSRIRHKTGHWVWIDGYITNLIDDDSINGIVANFRDISERKIAEDILAESERRFRDLLSTVQMISVVLDTNGNIIFCNDYLLKLTGWTQDEILGCNWFELFLVPEEYDVVIAIFNGVAKERKLKSHNENKIKTKKGDELLISWNNTALYDENGNLNSIASLGIDITKQKLAEEALKKSQLMLSETEKIGHVGGWQYNIATASLSWTDETYIIHDLTPQQNLTLEMGIGFYLPEYRSIIQDSVKRAIEFGEDFDLDLEILTAKNIRKYVHTVGRADLENLRIYGFIQDITKQKEFEFKLKESEQFFIESQKAARIGSYKLDFINDKWSSSEVLDQIFGIEENYLRTVSGLIDIVYDDEKMLMMDSFLQDISSKNKSFDKEFRIKRISDGEIRWVHGIGVFTFNESNAPLTMYGTVQDITLRKQSEIELKIIKERNQDILETAMEGYWRVDKKGKILEINKSMSLML